MSKITLIQRLGAYMQTLFQLYRKRYINVDKTFACYRGISATV